MSEDDRARRLQLTAGKEQKSEWVLGFFSPPKKRSNFITKETVQNRAQRWVAFDLDSSQAASSSHANEVVFASFGSRKLSISILTW